MNNDKIKKMRIPKEVHQLQLSYKNHGIKCTIVSENNLEAVVPGPKGSPYEEGIFKISISFGEQYPFRPPSFKFITPVYHPNIDSSGKICLDLLRMPPTGSYNPAITLESILLSIQLLLANPNPDDPLQGDAADLYKSNIDQFNAKARQFVDKNCRDLDAVGRVDTLPSEEYKELSKKRLKLSCVKSDK
ncbi:ubiquitin-conjugating enzyme E2 D2B-like [Musca vetustissima]|uniref:ubiquitin-conjugating enzyme E2 D2B-like n=1 Tax=Musca vetustissima TaxID=27455 RepID=UPI002AB76559|nr:ubiquitin-conjugating enzyme E2 D2B-like [Musca vetustissima]